MKRFFNTLIFTLAISSSVQAANMSSMEGMNMQQMMAQMQKMQQCLLKVDEAELRHYESRVSKLEVELRALCQAGDREQAQEKAIAFGKEITSSKAFKTIESCTKDMQINAFMPKVPDFDNLGDRHICNELTR